MSSAIGTVMLYDLERYGGEGRAPRYQRGEEPRFLVSGWARFPDERFARPVWTVSAQTYEEARGLVPGGGAYFDRSGNWPSPMVPIEGWDYDCAPPPSLASTPDEASS